LRCIRTGGSLVEPLQESVPEISKELVVDFGVAKIGQNAVPASADFKKLSIVQSQFPALSFRNFSADKLITLLKIIFKTKAAKLRRINDKYPFCFYRYGAGLKPSDPESSSYSSSFTLNENV
jgi:hypothetical protein